MPCWTVSGKQIGNVECEWAANEHRQDFERDDGLVRVTPADVCLNVGGIAGRVSYTLA